MTIRYGLNWDMCIAHLLTATLPGLERKSRSTINQLWEALDRNELSAAQVKEDIAKVGLGLLLPGEAASAAAGYVLAVPNFSLHVARLFENTRWAAAPHSEAGLWKDALRQAPPDIVMTDKRCNRIYVHGKTSRCTLVILRAARSCLSPTPPPQ
jgi:hypothetical protein